MLCKKCGQNLEGVVGEFCLKCRTDIVRLPEAKESDFSPTEVDFDSSATFSEISHSITGNPNSASQQTLAPLQDEYFNEKKSSKLPVMIVACVILVAIIIGVVYAWNRSPDNLVNQIVAAFADHNPGEAIDIFNANRDDIDMDALENALSQRLDDLRDEFRNEGIGYNRAMIEINAIRRFGLWRLDNQVAEAEQFIDSLNNSRVAFQVAETLYGHGDFLGAIENFELVLPEDANYNNALNGLNRAIEGFRADASDRAASYADRGEYGQAIFILDNALTLFGNEAQLAGQRESYARQDISARVASAQLLANAGNFIGAMNDLRLLEAEHSGNAEVARAIASVENNHITFIVGQADTFAADNRFADAIRELNEGLWSYPDNVTLTAARNNIEVAHVADILSQASEHIANEQFEAAVNLLNDGLRTYPGNAILTNALNETQTREIDILLAQAGAMVAEREFTEAINLLQNSRHSNNSRVLEKIAEINALLPVPLRYAAPFFDRNPNADYPQWAAVWFSDTGNTGGRQITNPLNFRNSGTTTSFTLHNLNNEFRVFSGYMGRADGTPMVNATVNILGDGNVLGTFHLRATDMPIPFSLSVEGVEQFRIEVDFPSTDHLGSGFLVHYIIQGFLER